MPVLGKALMVLTYGTDSNATTKDFESEPSGVSGDTESDMAECTLSGEGWETYTIAYTLQ